MVGKSTHGGTRDVASPDESTGIALPWSSPYRRGRWRDQRRAGGIEPVNERLVAVTARLRLEAPAVVEVVLEVVKPVMEGHRPVSTAIPLA